MKKVVIEYNPYTVRSKITVNGDEPKKNSTLEQFLDQRFQMWVDRIPELLKEEYNTSDFELTFHGTDSDYRDLLCAINLGEKKGIHIKAEQKPAKDFGNMEEALLNLINRIKELPIEDLWTPAVDDAVTRAFDDTLPVNVVATMSAGKSTLINALLGKELMPLKNGACTATITEIQDDDDSTFKADAFDESGKKISSYSNVEYKDMEELNENPIVKKICVKGNIPFVNSNETSLILIDTPGTDNSIDITHKLITEKALNESAKILVIFIINGRKPHDDGQNELLQKIAKSMSVGGKQSKERFLFAINQMDTYDITKDDIEGETIPDAVKYLESKGIKDPNIFPVSAYAALLVRKFLNTHNEEKRETIMDYLGGIMRRLNKYEQLHLEKYARLDSNSQMKINMELQTAIKNNDALGQALIHSGIRGIEETIRMYVTKYCRPAKITNVVDAFSKALDDAKAFEETKKAVAQYRGEKNGLENKIRELQKKLESRQESEAFKMRIAQLDINTSLSEKIRLLCGSVEDSLTKFFRNCPDEMEENEANEWISEFGDLVNDKSIEFQNAVNKLLNEDIKGKAEKLRDEYIKKLTALSSELKIGNLNIDLTSFVGSKLESMVLLDSENMIDNSLDSRIEEHEEERIKKVNKKYSFKDRIFHISRWFNPNYLDEVSEKVKVKEKITFVSKGKLSNEAIAPIRKVLDNERDRILAFANEETQNIKNYFYEQFDAVDAVLLKKTKELGEVTKSKEAAEQSLKKAEALLDELDKIKAELEEILEI